MRAELLPLLQARFNPAAVEVLADQAELARAEWTWMEEQIAASGLEAKPDDDEPGAMVLPVPELERAPVSGTAGDLESHDGCGGRTPGIVPARRGSRSAHPNPARRCAGNRAADRVSDRSVDAPGHFVERVGARLVLRTGASGGTGAMSAFRYRLPVPGEVELPEAGYVVSAEP